MQQNSLVATLRRQLADERARNAVLNAECGELRGLLIATGMRLDKALAELERVGAGPVVPVSALPPDDGAVVRQLTLVRESA